MLAEPRPGGGRRRQLTSPAPRAVGQAHGEADGERAAQGTLLPARWPGGVAASPRSAHTHGQRENRRARAGEQLSCEGDAPTGAERGAQGRGAGPPPWRPGRGSATTTLEFRCFRKCFLLKVNFRYHKTSACQGTDPATFSTFQMCHHRPHLVPKYCASAEGPCRRAAGKNVTKSTQQKRRRETHRTT